jgi:release factor glutamine methyltransferase
MHSRAKKAFFGNFAFDVCENVYEPAEDSFLFAENLRITEEERALDVGTGTGILGIIAAKTTREVVAVDINPHAVQCAKRNASANGVQDKMSFLRSDLFASLRETAKFDVILFNAPYLPAEDSETEEWLGRAWAGGETGRTVIDRFIAEAPLHVERTGRILLMQSTLAGVEETQRGFTKLQMASRVVASLRLPFFETLTLLEAKFTLQK